MSKVYCTNCIFFSVIEGEVFPFGPPDFKVEKCLSPSNFKDTYSSPKVYPISIPKIINKFNNCEWYVAKESTGSSSNGTSSSSNNETSSSSSM